MYLRTQGRRSQYSANHPVIANSLRVRNQGRMGDLYSCTNLSIWVRKLSLEKTNLIFC